MSDENELNGLEPTAPTAAPVGPAPKPSSGDFLSTSGGKVLLLVLAVLVLLVVAGIVGWFVLGPASLGTGTPAAPTPVTSQPGTPATPSTPAPAIVATEPLPATVTSVTLRDVFTPRNPFTVIEPDVIPTETVSTGNDNNDTSGIDPTVVTVTGVKTVSGVLKAIIAFGGTVYTVGPGESFGGHADWTVVTVHTASVDVLMGGDTVNLPVQHIASK